MKQRSVIFVRNQNKTLTVLNQTDFLVPYVAKSMTKNNIFRDTCCLTKGGFIAPIAQSRTPGKTALFVTGRRDMVKR